MIFTIQEIEYWMELTQDDFTASGNVEAIGFNIDDTQTTWLADGITHTIETIEELKATFEKHSHEINANACLVHALTLASIEYYIDYDPDVLTKPAYILRAKKEHIRFLIVGKSLLVFDIFYRVFLLTGITEVNNILRDKTTFYQRILWKKLQKFFQNGEPGRQTRRNDGNCLIVFFRGYRKYG